MTSTLTTEQTDAIRTWLADDGRGCPRHIPAGLGTAEAACSIAAINLALTHTLTDVIPPCMSAVIGRWIIQVQDSMPATMRNGAAWRDLLPLAAGTGRSREAERLRMILEWMWATVLPAVQPIADAHGFGPSWFTMTTQMTWAAAWGAAAAAEEEARVAPLAAARVASLAAQAAARVASLAEEAAAAWGAAAAAEEAARVASRVASLVAAQVAAEEEAEEEAQVAAEEAAQVAARVASLAASLAAAQAAASVVSLASLAAEEAAAQVAWRAFAPDALLARLIAA